jgi:hypothetical protein
MNIPFYFCFFCIVQASIGFVVGEQRRRWEGSLRSTNRAINIASKYLVEQAQSVNTGFIPQKLIRPEYTKNDYKVTKNYSNLRRPLPVDHFQILNTNSTSSDEKKESHISMIMILITAGAVVGIIVSALCCCFLVYKCIHCRKGRGKVYEEDEKEKEMTGDLTKSKTAPNNAKDLISPREKSVSVSMSNLIGGRKGSVNSTTSSPSTGAAAEAKEHKEKKKSVGFVGVTADDVDKEVYKRHRQTHRESFHHAVSAGSAENSEEIQSSTNSVV